MGASRVNVLEILKRDPLLVRSPGVDPAWCRSTLEAAIVHFLGLEARPSRILATVAAPKGEVAKALVRLFTEGFIRESDRVVSAVVEPAAAPAAAPVAAPVAPSQAARGKTRVAVPRLEAPPPLPPPLPAAAFAPPPPPPRVAEFEPEPEPEPELDGAPVSPPAPAPAPSRARERQRKTPVAPRAPDPISPKVRAALEEAFSAA